MVLAIRLYSIQNRLHSADACVHLTFFHVQVPASVASKDFFAFEPRLKTRAFCHLLIIRLQQSKPFFPLVIKYRERWV
jgi:hypothetical protein